MCTQKNYFVGIHLKLAYKTQQKQKAKKTNSHSNTCNHFFKFGFQLVNGQTQTFFVSFDIVY